ncbi:hypothetical protein ACTVWX_29600, partial [Pseudomonas aeruginosa]
SAVVLIGEALGLQQLYIIDGDRHGTLQPEKKTPPRRGVGSRIGGAVVQRTEQAMLGKLILTSHKK